ncbi:hypothetical protein J3F84DRAFT_158382 [Trichoderma pleuroticola]
MLYRTLAVKNKAAILMAAKVPSTTAILFACITSSVAPVFGQQSTYLHQPCLHRHHQQAPTSRQRLSRQIGVPSVAVRLTQIISLIAITIAMLGRTANSVRCSVVLFAREDWWLA